MTKAQIVKALKAMSRSLVHGDRVAAILNKSPVWSEYKDQRHDLFITSTHTAGYLTAGTAATAGYLTQGNTNTLPDVPPPIDREDSLARTDAI